VALLVLAKRNVHPDRVVHAVGEHRSLAGWQRHHVPRLGVIQVHRRADDYLDWYPRDGRAGLHLLELVTVRVLQFCSTCQTAK
jgi:hypothetical protein